MMPSKMTSTINSNMNCMTAIGLKNFKSNSFQLLDQVDKNKNGHNFLQAFNSVILSADD